MKIFAFLPLLFLLVGCSGITYKERLFDKVANETIAHMEKKYDFSILGSGGSIPDDIKGFFLHYTTSKNVEPEEARILLVEATEDLLNRVNSNEEIRPFLYKHPFTCKEAEVLISFNQPNGKPIKPPNVALALLVSGRVYFEGRDEKTDKLFTLPGFPQSYEKAFKIVQSEKILYNVKNSVELLKIRKLNQR